MLSPDLHFEGFDARTWGNLLALFAPGIIEERDAPAPDHEAPEIIAPATPPRPVGSMWIVVDERDRVLSAFHSTRGALKDVNHPGTGLAALATEYGARRVFVLREGLVDELTERLSQRLVRGDDYLTQILVMLRILREFQEAGILRTWPRSQPNVPIPAAATVRRSMDLILPDGKAFLAVLWEGTTPATAVALRRQHGSIDLVAGPDLISRWVGALGGDWRRDHRYISDAISRSLADVHFGIFAQYSELKALLRKPDPGAWARAVVVRDIIIHPMPAYVSVALGADTVRAVAKKSADMVGGVDALSALLPLATFLRNQLTQISSVTDALGFNPLSVLATSLSRYVTTPGEVPAPDPSVEVAGDET